mgnify:CR=1 FL=1
MSESKPFPVGSEVYIIGLEDAPHLNGRRGKISTNIIKDADSIARQGIDLHDPWIDPKTKKEKWVRLSIRVDNLMESNTDIALKLGDLVLLYNLKAIEYNGKRGKIYSLPKQDDPEGRYGVLLDGSKDPIGIRALNIFLPKKRRKATAQLREERNNNCVDYAISTSKKNMDADQLAMMRMMMNMFLTKCKQVEVFGREIEPLPDFCAELENHGGGFPAGVDPKWAKQYLRTAFEQSSNLPHFFEFYIKGSNYEPSSEDIWKALTPIILPSYSGILVHVLLEISFQYILPKHTAPTLQIFFDTAIATRPIEKRCCTAELPILQLGLLTLVFCLRLSWPILQDQLLLGRSIFSGLI